MRRKKINLEIETINNVVKISRDFNDCYFEISDEITKDVAEAVCIMMRKVKWDDPIWQTEVRENEICPEKSLFWLSGGDSEWLTMRNYKKNWCECCSEFDDEFGFLVSGIVKKSKTLLDIRNGFVKYLNLLTLYDFAISRNMIR